MDELLTPKALSEKVPSTTPAYWATLRFHGKGPKYYKPSPKRIFYAWPDVEQWLLASAQEAS